VTERPALAGITPILATPYREDGRIAIDDIERQVDHLAGLAVTAIGIGFGSDILRLTDAERDGLVRAVAAAADGRRPVLASAGANSLRAALDRAAATRDAGADILMVTPPGASSSPTPAGLADYYRTIATEIGLPVVVQDAPALTGTPMSAALLAGLGRDIPGIAAIKIETMPPAPKVGDVAALPHGPAAILGGAGGIDFYHELERGADGTVPGVAMAELFVAVAARHASSDRAGARRLFNRYLPLLAIAARGGDTFFAVQLAILARRGIVTRTAIRPPSDVDPRLAGEVAILLDDLGIDDGPWQPESEVADGD
jgi:4-hydroxy-tetrahydrodipicolinate synthase